jgi:hypothetical protein
MSKREENNMWNNVLVGAKNESLPSNGWMHSCYFCNNATSRVKKLFYNEKEYYTFQCKDCANHTR